MHENIRKKKGRWESFADMDGLGHGCQCLMEDKDGNLWIGSWQDGLSRYDGKKFVNFTIKDGLVGNNVSAIYQSIKGNIWIGTNDGLNRYDGEKFVSFTIKSGLAGSNVFCIQQDQQDQQDQKENESIWIGTNGGLSRYDGKSFVNFTSEDGLANNNVRCLYQDRGGNIWTGHWDWWNGTWYSGLSRYDGSGFINFTNKDGLISDDVQCVCQDQKGYIWIGTKIGLSRYDGKKFVNFTHKDGLAGNDILCIQQDKEGNIWIGTENLGVSCYDGNEFVNFTVEDGLANNFVRHIIQDREGNLWFACGHGGISRYNPNEISAISNESVKEAMLQDRSGNLWWGFVDILSQFDGKEINHYPFESPIFEVFEDSRGQFWIGTQSRGVFICDNLKDLARNPNFEIRNLTVDDGLINNGIWEIFEDKNGNIWVGTWGGVSKYNGKEFINFTTDDGLGSNIISVIYQDRNGALWFAGWNGGGISIFSIYHSDKTQGKNERIFCRYTIDDGLVDDRVVCITEDNKGNLWIGTHAGLSCYDGKAFRNYTTENGLLSSLIQRIFQDSRGQIWVATLGGGVNRFDGKNFQALTTDDGLPSNCVTGIIEDSDSSLIISTYRGICRYLPDYKTSPFIKIDEVDADKIYKEPKDVQISEGASSIRIRYHGISLKTKRIRYNYILEGYDPDWKATWEEEVRYENLPLGEYRFKVIAINRDLVCSEEPAELRFKVIADPRERVISELEERVRERTKQLEKANEALKQLAYYDSLTNLPNRRLFTDRLTLELAHAKRNKQALAVMFIDLDYFKNINDTLGHEGGDQFLKDITKRLSRLLRKVDTVARLGGDEFILLLPEINYIQDTIKIAQRIIETIKQPWMMSDYEFHITSSIGIAVYPKDGEEPETLLRNADTAMYRAKERGRNNYQFYTQT